MSSGKIQVNIQRINKNAVLPVYQTQNAAGADLCACIEKPMTIAPLSRALVPTGVAIEIAESGFAAFVFARSGLASRNGVGVIDSDYRGEIKVAITNSSDTAYTISPGERIAQLVFMPVAQAEFIDRDKLSKTNRMDGGFGSTGKI